MATSIKKNATYNLVKIIFSIAFPLLTTPYVLRILQPENFGKVNFTLSVISYFSLIATLGVSVYGIRECSAVKNDKSKLDLIASQIFSISVITAIISLILLFLSVFFIPKLTEYCLLFAIESLSIVFVVLGADWLNTSMSDFKYITIRTVVFQILSLIFIFLLVKDKSDYVIYVCILIFSTCGANALNIFYRRHFCSIRFTFSLDLRKHLPPIFSLFALQVSQAILLNIDTTMLGFFLGDYYVGLYGVPIKIIAIAAQIVASITWVVLPLLSKSYADGNYQVFNDTLHKTLNFTVTLTVPCVIGLILLSEEIVVSLGGIEYQKSAVCLIIFAIVLIYDLGVNNLYGNCVLLTTKSEKIFCYACFVAMLFNIIGNYYLIPIYGIVGAALSTASSKLLISLIVIQNRNKRISFNASFRTFLSPIVGGLAVGLVCLTVKYFISNLYLILLISFIISVITYFMIQLLLKNEIVSEYYSSFKKRFLN